MRNFNENFGKNITYDNIKSHKKQGFTLSLEDRFLTCPIGLRVNKLKSAIKNETDVISGLSSNITGNSNQETNFTHKLLLTNTQVVNLRTAFANN